MVRSTQWIGHFKCVATIPLFKRQWNPTSCKRGEGPYCLYPPYLPMLPTLLLCYTEYVFND